MPKIEIVTECRAMLRELWIMDWPHDTPPTVEEADEALSDGSRVEYVREWSVEETEEDREIIEINGEAT